MTPPRGTALGVVALAMVAVAASAAAAERHLDESSRYQFEAGKRLVVDVEDQEVEVRVADIDEIRVRLELAISGVGAHKAESWIAAQTPSIVDGPDELVVSSHPSKTGFLALGYLTSRARLRVLVPPGAGCDISTAGGSITLRGDLSAADPLQLRSATGAISFVGTAPAIDVRTVSGEVRLELLRATRSLFARTSSGSVTLAGGAASAEVDTASGDVHLDNLSGSATVATTTGRIALRWVDTTQSDRISVRSTSGSVALTLPASADPAGSITTTGGTISGDLAPADSGQPVRQLAGVGPRLEVETASGDVTVVRGDIWDPPRLD